MYLFRPTSDRTTASAARAYRINITAMDHPGIVHTVAEFFSDSGINIHELHTNAAPAAHTGTPIFSANFTIEIPATLKAHDIRQRFESFCVDHDLDFEFRTI